MCNFTVIANDISLADWTHIAFYPGSASFYVNGSPAQFDCNNSSNILSKSLNIISLLIIAMISSTDEPYAYIGKNFVGSIRRVSFS